MHDANPTVGRIADRFENLGQNGKFGKSTENNARRFNRSNYASNLSPESSVVGSGADSSAAGSGPFSAYRTEKASSEKKSRKSQF
jgi:hypothetical protein